MSIAPAPVAALPRDGLATMLGRRGRDWVPALFVLVAFLIVIGAEKLVVRRAPEHVA